MVSTFQNNHFYISPYSNSISWIRKLYFKLFVPTSLSRAERIIAVSYSAKNDLLNYCSALDNKIRVVYEGVSNGFYPKTAVDEDSWQAIKTQYCLKDPFILFVSTLRSFKNADKVIMAYNKIRQEHKTKAQLVIIGNPAEKDYVKYLHSLVQKYDIRSNVVFINHVDRDKLRQFYIFAALLVYPSALETFGLPPLEAMACGCPVIISNRTSLPEVSGAAALIVDPENVVELAEAMLKILRDKELKQELISKGYEQAKKYDWGKSAREVLRVIKEIHEQSQSLH
jgi:glycosyltransferase involved in cell wall biosynthesis